MTRWGYTARTLRGTRNEPLSDDPGPIRHAHDPGAPKRRHRLVAECGASLVGLGRGEFNEPGYFDPNHPRACPRCRNLASGMVHPR